MKLCVHIYIYLNYVYIYILKLCVHIYIYHNMVFKLMASESLAQPRNPWISITVNTRSLEQWSLGLQLGAWRQQSTREATHCPIVKLGKTRLISCSPWIPTLVKAQKAQNPAETAIAETSSAGRLLPRSRRCNYGRDDGGWVMMTDGSKVLRCPE